MKRIFSEKKYYILSKHCLLKITPANEEYILKKQNHLTLLSACLIY